MTPARGALADRTLLADTLERIGVHERRHPGTLAAALRREADFLDWRTSRDSTARPGDAVTYRQTPPGCHGWVQIDEDRPGDWTLEDRHWRFKDAGGVPRFALRAMARRLAGLLEVRRRRLRVGAVDGRPFGRAA